MKTYQYINFFIWFVSPIPTDGTDALLMSEKLIETRPEARALDIVTNGYYSEKKQTVYSPRAISHVSWDVMEQGEIISIEGDSS